MPQKPNKGARGNGDIRHASCGRASRARCRRGSSLAWGTAMRSLALLAFFAVGISWVRAEHNASPRLSVGEVIAAFERTEAMQFPLPAKAYWKEAGFRIDHSDLFLSSGGERDFRWMRYRLTDSDNEGRFYTLTIFFEARSTQQDGQMVHRVLFAEEQADYDSSRPVRILASPGCFFSQYERWREQVERMPNQATHQTTRSVTPPADAGDRALASRESS